MSSLIQFPFNRTQYAGIDNPLFISDILAANQQVQDALTALCGLGPADFAIFSGLAYTPGSGGPGSYTPGIFYLSGAWYYMATGFNENLYLAPNVQPFLSKTFDDGNARNIYSINYGGSTNVSAGSSPQFIGNMNQYRLDLKSMGANIIELLSAITLTNVQVASLPSTYVVQFDKDRSVFCAAAPVNVAITFDFTNAVPGTVHRLKFTFAAGRTLTVTTPAGSVIYLDGGDPTRAAGATNVLYFMYAGLNESNNPEVSYTISQVA